MKDLRLNIGCGRHVIKGWFCIDAQPHPAAARAPDLLCDVKNIPLPDGCASEAIAIHVFEHFYRWECDDLIEEWKRLLKSGGKLTLEMPDLMKFCRNILTNRQGRHPDQMGLWAMYGDPRTKDPYMVHRWAWTFNSIAPFLKEHGFVDVYEETPQWHLVGKGVRDFRVTAKKA